MYGSLVSHSRLLPRLPGSEVTPRAAENLRRADSTDAKALASGRATKGTYIYGLAVYVAQQAVEAGHHRILGHAPPCPAPGRRGEHPAASPRFAWASCARPDTE